VRKEIKKTRAMANGFRTLPVEEERIEDRRKRSERVAVPRSVEVRNGAKPHRESERERGVDKLMEREDRKKKVD